MAAFKAGRHDGVIAFGGGSALDAGKAVALMVGQERPLWDFEDVGDNYLRVLARAISTAAEGIVDGSPSQPFRVGGDEFLLVSAGQVLADPDALANDIRTRLGASLATLGMSGGVHASAWVYESTPRSAAEVLKRLHHALRHDAGDETDGLLPRWADSMMDWMFRRIGETVRLLDDANAAALSDEISGQPNHRAAVMELEGWNEEVAAGAQHCLLFIDGDNLKRYNTLGYEVGNHMIRDLAGALRRSVRAEDGLYRWLSGDEFIVTLRNTDRPTAIRLAERIRSQVETTTRGWVFPITVSIGVACLPTDATTTTEPRFKVLVPISSYRSPHMSPNDKKRSCSCGFLGNAFRQ